MSARGTTNTNVRGSSRDRARRRAYLVETYRADVDAVDATEHTGRQLLLALERAA